MRGVFKMNCDNEYCFSCNQYNKYCICFKKSIKLEKISEEKYLDKALKKVNVKEYEDIIELWITYGGD